MTQTAIVIVTCNSAGHIGAALDAALAHCARVVVVDNASEDDTCSVVRSRSGARLIVNQSNRGFAAAVNQGVGACDSEFILLLNPDAVLLAGLEDLVEACRRPEVGAAAGLLLSEDGKPQAGFTLRRFPTAAALCFEALGINRLWPANPVNRRYRCLDLDLQQPGEAEQPPGAFLMIRRDVWQRLGGLDEGYYPLWFEDVDFLKRLRDGGQRVRYVPAARARHHGGHSVERLTATSRTIYWYSSLLRYAQRHLRPTAFRAVCTAVAVGALVRLVTGMAGRRSLQPVASYGKVFRLAGRCLCARRWQNEESGVVKYQSAEAAEKQESTTQVHGS